MKVTITGSKDVSARELLDMAQETLKDTMISDIYVGAANGEAMNIRGMVHGEPRWMKTYTYKVSADNLFIDIQHDYEMEREMEPEDDRKIPEESEKDGRKEEFEHLLNEELAKRSDILRQCGCEVTLEDISWR